jgi:hypothetical protein
VAEVVDIDGHAIDLSNGWLPARTILRRKALCVVVAKLEGRQLNGIFTSEDVRRCREFRVVCYDDLEIPKRYGAGRLRGFVFHAGRTGSTLAVKLLRETGLTHVVAESKAAGDLFRLSVDIGDSLLESSLRKLMYLFDNSLAPEPDNLVFKWSSWHTLQLETIRRCFPEVPSLFLWRHPVEIVSAILDESPAWLDRSTVRRMDAALTPDQRVLFRRALGHTYCGLDFFREVTFTEFVVDAISGILNAAARNRDYFDACIEYPHITRAIAEQAGPIFGIDLRSKWEGITPAVTATDAKTRGSTSVFRPDSERKRREVPPWVHSLVEERTGHDLDALRCINVLPHD